MSGIDLSVCKGGDVLEQRNGEQYPFAGLTPLRHPYRETHPYMSRSGQTYRKDGTAATTEGVEWNDDIVRVLRDGKQVQPCEPEADVTPTPAGTCSTPNWRIDADARDAFDSLLAEAGDRFFEVAFRIARSEAPDVIPVVMTKDHVAEAYGRFKIGGAQSGLPLEVKRTPAPAEQAEGEVTAFAWDEHSAAVAGSVDVFQDSVAPIPPAAAEPGDVIQGPGLYRTERWEESGADRHLAHVEASGNGKWYGWIGLEDVCMAWASNGRCLSPGTVVDITGPYVTPPEPPKPLSLLEASQEVLNGIDWEWLWKMNGTTGQYSEPYPGLKQLKDAVERELAKVSTKEAAQ